MFRDELFECDEEARLDGYTAGDVRVSGRISSCRLWRHDTTYGRTRYNVKAKALGMAQMTAINLRNSFKPHARSRYLPPKNRDRLVIIRPSTFRSTKVAVMIVHGNLNEVLGSIPRRGDT